MARILHYTFMLLVWLSILKYKFHRSAKTNNNSKKKIAALPYYPKNWPGGEDRIAAWKSYFEKDGFEFNIFWAWEAPELEAYFKNTKDKKEISRYKLFFKLLKRRKKILDNVLQHDTIWIQRNYLPLYPFKTPKFERVLQKLHNNVIYDYYDADYESNYNLVMETVKIANKVTVASKFLEEKFKPLNSQTNFVRFAIKKESFIKSNTKLNSNTIKIGWMGSPENAKQLIHIKDQLVKIESEFPNAKFSFVCRDLPDLQLKRAEIFKWGDEGFDYYEWLSKLDIGLVPFINQTDRVKAKISMKGLEFLANRVASVSSPYIHSDVLEDKTSFLLTDENNWFNNLRYLINNPQQRVEIAEKGFQLFNKYHTFNSVYSELKIILTK
jgi:hypothetical protein